MKRREFINTTAVAAASLAASSFAVKPAVAAPQAFTLLRSDVAEAGAIFHPLSEICASCDTESVRVHLDALHAAGRASALREFSLSAMFEPPASARAPYLAWHYVHGTVPRNSQRVSFVASRASMRGFELEYRFADAQACREDCALTQFGAPLMPGHYVLVGPQRDGSKLRAVVLRHNGDANAPLGGTRDFDYFAFRVTPVV